MRNDEQLRLWPSGEAVGAAPAPLIALPEAGPGGQRSCRRLWLFPECALAAERLGRASPLLRQALRRTLDLLLGDPAHPSLALPLLTAHTAPRLGLARVAEHVILVYQVVADDELVALHVGEREAMARWAAQYRGDAAQRLGDALLSHGGTGTPRARARSATGWQLSLPHTEALAARSSGSRAPLPLPRLDPGAPLPCGSGADLDIMLDLGLDRYLTALSPAQRRAVQLDAPGLLLFQGTAGGGKTAVAVHRLKRHADQQALFAERRVLYLCYNRVRADTVPQLLQTLYGARPPRSIEIQTVDGWCLRYLRAQQVVPPGFQAAAADAGYWQSFRRLYAREHRRAPDFWDRYPGPFLEEELRVVIHGRHVPSAEAYAAIDRVGRGRPLAREDRPALWALFAAQREQARAAGLLAYSEYAGQALDTLSTDEKFSPYDHVEVDEAQDLSPSHIRLALALAGGAAGRVALYADMAQDIYGRGYRWHETGLVGTEGRRGVVLDHNYRNTIEIHQAALALAAGLTLDDPTDFVWATASDRHGERPTILLASSPEHECAAVVSRVRALLAAGVPPHDIAVLAGTAPILGRFGRAFDAAGLAWQRPGVLDERGQLVRRIDLVHPSVKLLTAHGAKGLDFAHVFIVGLTRDGLPPLQPTAAARQAQRRLLYTTVVRAACSLTLAAGGAPHPLLEELAAVCTFWQVA